MFLNNNINWSDLTVSNQKEKLFANDFYFEFSYQIAHQFLGDNISGIINNYVLVFIKPEAFITKKINILIDDLKTYGFELVYVKTKPISSVDISELWKYSWSAASLIRIIVNQTYYSSFLCGILVLRNLVRPCKYKDTCSYFSELKGHTTTEGIYKDPQIRYHMNAINTFLNCVHSPDDNADFIRELAIFFDWNDLSSVYYRMLHNITVDFSELLSKAEDYPFFAEEVNATDVLDKYILIVRQKIVNSSSGFVDIYELKNILDALLLVRQGDIKFSDSLLDDLIRNKLWSWDWQSFIMLTQYMTYSNGNTPLL